MLKRLNQHLASTSRGKLFFLGLLLIGISGVLDHSSGYEIAFSIFYLGPVAISWYCGRNLGVLLCLISTIVWMSVDYTAGHQYSQTWIFFWNALHRFAIFYFAVYGLDKIKNHLTQEEVLARTDALTELSNSRHFREQAELMFHMAKRQEQPLALAYIDLDNFKSVNDDFGHETGDLVLKQVGKVIAASLRGSDVAGRLGGDEFAVLLTGTSIEGAQTYFNRLQQRLIETMTQHGWPVGFSVGVAVYSEAFPDATRALHEADDLMYLVKKAGKNRVFCKQIKTAEPT